MNTRAISRCHIRALLSLALDNAIDAEDWVTAEHLLRAMEGLSRDGVIRQSVVERAYLHFARAPKASSDAGNG